MYAVDFFHKPILRLGACPSGPVMTTRLAAALAFFMAFANVADTRSQTLSLQGVPTPDPPTGPGCARRFAEHWMPGLYEGVVDVQASAAYLAAPWPGPRRNRGSALEAFASITSVNMHRTGACTSRF